MQEEAQRIIDSNQLKNMLSIFNSFLFANTKAQSLAQEKADFYLSNFKMLCEILNSYRDTYFNLHCCLTLAAFCKTMLVEEMKRPVVTLFTKLTSANVGLDDSAALFLGHAMVHCELEQPLIANCIARIQKTQAPSAIKSFSLPVFVSMIT